jgi:hypothetical protein
MRWIVSALLSLFVCTATVMSQPPKGMDKKPGDKMDKSSPTSATEPSMYAGETLKQWIEKLDSKDAAVRDTALRVLPTFGPAAEVALPKMIRMMVDPYEDTSVCVSAIRIVTMNSWTDKEKNHDTLVKNLNTLMVHTSSILRLQAALAAGRLDDGTGCIAKLCDLLKDGHSYEVRRAAALSLAAVARGTAETGPDMRAVVSLVNCMNSDTSLVIRGEAVQSLITLGPPRFVEDWDKEKAALVARLAKETVPAQKMWLRVCLMRMDPTMIKPNMPLVTSELNNPKIRVAAAEAIGMMGHEGKVCVKELTAGVKNVEDPENWAFAAMCMWALAQMESDAFPALGDIQKLLKHTNGDLRVYAEYAQKKITTGLKLANPK